MSNVIKLAYQKENEIEEMVEGYLEYVGRNSYNTKRTYRSQIKSFFEETRNKSIKELVLADLKYTYLEMTKYYVGLKEKHGLKTKTRNTRMNAIKGLFEFFEKNDYEINMKAFNLDLESNNYDSEMYEILSYDEAMKICDSVATQKHGIEKSLFVELAIVTSFRLDSMMNLKWENFHKTENGTNYIKVLGKGNVWDSKSIREDLFEELVSHQADDVYVFPSINNGVYVKRMIDKALEDIGWEGRNITFHSFKKAGIQAVKIITNGNIKAMQRQGSHADASTTLNNYDKDVEDLDSMPSVLIGQKVDFSPLEELSKEELLKLIDKGGFELKMKLLSSLNNK